MSADRPTGGVADMEVAYGRAWPQTAMIALRPGDKVLVTLNYQPSAQQVHDFAAQLRERFPGIEFSVIAGVQSIAVQAPTSSCST